MFNVNTLPEFLFFYQPLYYKKKELERLLFKTSVNQRKPRRCNVQGIGKNNEKAPAKGLWWERCPLRLGSHEWGGGIVQVRECGKGFSERCLSQIRSNRDEEIKWYHDVSQRQRQRFSTCHQYPQMRHNLKEMRKLTKSLSLTSGCLRNPSILEVPPYHTNSRSA